MDIPAATLARIQAFWDELAGAQNAAFALDSQTNKQSTHARGATPNVSGGTSN